MSDTAPTAPAHPEPQHFRPQWFRLVIVCALMLAAVAFVGSRLPLALLPMIPILGLVLMLYGFLTAGLILSRDGIEWYALHPRLRFRTVPWDAVVDVRSGLLGLGTWIRLIVKSDRYEPWVRGTPRPDQLTEIQLWPNSLTGGAALRAAIEQWRSAHDRADRPDTEVSSPPFS